MYELTRPTVLILLLGAIFGSSSSDVQTSNSKESLKLNKMLYNHLTYVNATAEITKLNMPQLTLSSGNDSVESTTDSGFQNETFTQSTQSEKTNKLHFPSSEARYSNTHYNHSYFSESQTNLSSSNLNTSYDHGDTDQSDSDKGLTVVTTLSTEAHRDQKKVFFSKETPYQNIPYHIQSGAGRIHRLTLDPKKIALQHHLQLVPMEDEPLDTMMFKDQRFLISVLVPIGIGMIGAAMIIGTVFTLRYVARKRAPHSFIDNGTEVEGSITPCISSISTETTDKMFLLLGDDEI